MRCSLATWASTARSISSSPWGVSCTSELRASAGLGRRSKAEFGKDFTQPPLQQHSTAQRSD